MDNIHVVVNYCEVFKAGFAEHWQTAPYRKGIFRYELLQYGETKGVSKE